MKTRTRSSRRVATSLGALPLVFLASCLEIDPLYKLPDFCARFEAIPLADLTAPDPNDPTYPQVGFETPGQIKVMHGFGGAKLDAGKRIIKVEQSVAVPDYANKATVFLNGWRLTYLGGEVDNNVAHIGALITKITFDLRNKRLTWNAAGNLADVDFNEGYSFTYYYTVIAWNDVALNVIVDHSDCTAATNFPNKSFTVMHKGSTAVLSFSSYNENPTFPVAKPVAVLPRGFGFFWAPDHHLLQIAYNLDHSEIFAEGGKRYIRNQLGQTLRDTPIGELAPLPDTTTSRADAGFGSWDTFAILKDDESHRDYVFDELVSALSGTEVGLIQPPFAINPRDGEFYLFGPVGGSAGARTQEFVVENVPFAVAIPMLTGWELYFEPGPFGLADREIRDVGIWIDHWTYSPGPSGGTLTYTLGSVLGDKDYAPDFKERHRVTILGIGPLAGGGGVLKKGSAQ